MQTCMATEGAPNPTHPILLVDDEEYALTSMSIALLSSGFNNLQKCADSREVVPLLSEKAFSLVLIDLSMPYIGGHDIIALASTLERRPPFVIVTANTRIDDYARGAGAVVDYLVKPVDRDRLIASVRRALAQPAAASADRLTRRFLLSDGVVNDSTGSVSMANDSAARETTARETTARNAATERGIASMLGFARSEYRGLIAGLPMPYVVLDEGTYRVRCCSDAFLRFMGLDTVFDARALVFFDLLDTGVKTRVLGTLRTTGVLHHEEIAGRTPGGRPFVIVGSFRLSSSDGSAEGGFVDITEHKAVEQELARTSRLTAVGRLAAGLAHDFNNTLQVITGFNELVSMEAGVSEAVRDGTAQIRLAASRAEVIIRQLLTMGHAAGEPRGRSDLNAALAEAESSLRQHLRPGQSLVLSLNAADPRVEIPVAQVDQVVRNLVLNARDAMPLGGTITISTSTNTPAASGSPGSVLLQVRDTGTGMDGETLQRVFEPFFTTKTPDKGTGLGLSTVQLIVEAAGGSLRVESTPGEGTLFSAVLPSAASADSHGRLGLTGTKTGSKTGGAS